MAIGLEALIWAGVTVSLQNLVSPPFVGASWDDARRDHIWSIITCPKPEHETCVAPSIKRAKS